MAFFFGNGGGGFPGFGGQMDDDDEDQYRKFSFLAKKMQSNSWVVVEVLAVLPRRR